MRNKFTLMELMIVVAIIGLLITLLLPSLKNARAASLSAVCLSNLNQQGVAAYSYARDNHHRFVIRILDANYKGYWPNVMYENNYLPREETVMTCPSLPVTDVDWETFPNYQSRAYGVAYDKTSFKRVGYEIDSDFHTIKSSLVESPDEFYHYVDSAKEKNGVFYQPIVIWWHAIVNNQSQGVHTRHNGAANVWFLDGHVQGNRQGNLKRLGVFGGWTERNAQVPF